MKKTNKPFFPRGYKGEEVKMQTPKKFTGRYHPNDPDFYPGDLDREDMEGNRKI